VSINSTIGGARGVSAAVDDFYRRVLADPHLAGYFTGVDVDRVRAHQRMFIAAGIGGPGSYRGRPMREAHGGLRIRDADFDRVVEHLAATLTALGVATPTIAGIADLLGPLREQIVDTPAVGIITGAALA
jgi:hemoglobin